MYANEHLPKSRVIVCNGDIYFNHTLRELDEYDLRGAMLTLTRWNELPNGSLEPFRPSLAVITKCGICGHTRPLLHERDIEDCYYQPSCGRVKGCAGTAADLKIYPGSNVNFSSLTQDAWIFETPIEIDFRCDYKLGTYHCDGYLNYQLLKSKTLSAICNPADDIQCCHVHNSNVKSQDDIGLIVNDQEHLKRNEMMGNLQAAVPIRPLDSCGLKKRAPLHSRVSQDSGESKLP
jgi:hypothetical protein